MKYYFLFDLLNYYYFDNQLINRRKFKQILDALHDEGFKRVLYNRFNKGMIDIDLVERDRRKKKGKQNG